MIGSEKIKEDGLTLIDHENGLGGATQKRGMSFIAAAELILNNMPQNTSDHNILKNEIIAIRDYWESKKTTVTPKHLAELERALIETLNNTVYKNKPKSFKKVKAELDNAENHVNWKRRDPQINNTQDKDKDDPVEISRTEAPISQFTTELTTEWQRILLKGDEPSWFKVLPHWEQNYFKSRLKEWKEEKPLRNLGEFLGSVPTTIRRYPGAPNAFVTTVKLKRPALEKGGEETFIKIRSGTIVPTKMKARNKKEKADKVYATKLNLEQLLVEAIKVKLQDPTIKSGEKITLPILFQTLYSPPFQPPGEYNNEAVMKALDLIRKELKTPEATKAFMEKHKLNDFINNPRSVKLNIDLLYSNRPVNNARGLSSFLNLFSKQGRESRHTDKMLSKYVKNLKKDINAMKNTMKIKGDLPLEMQQKYFMTQQKYNMAKEALKSYRNMPYIRNTMFMVPPTQNNALAEKAALEQIIAGKVGIRVGSCVSGKDREEMITEIAIAQQEFYLKYRKFPPPYNASSEEDKKLREEFHTNVARQYLTGYGHKLAALNSEGCDGLKNIVDVFGKDICTKIEVLAPEFGIKDLNLFHPIKDVQKVAGLNKLSEKKLNVDTVEFLENVKSHKTATPLPQTEPEPLHPLDISKNPNTFTPQLQNSSPPTLQASKNQTLKQDDASENKTPDPNKRSTRRNSSRF